MGDFIKAIRKGEVFSPLRGDFNLQSWFAAGQPRDGVDLPDLQLVLAGYLVEQKLRRLREKFETLNLAEYPPDTVRQACIAIANRDLATLHGKMDEKVRQAAGRAGTVYMDEILSTKVQTLNGCSYSIDDVAAAGVDGIVIPIRRSFKYRGNKSMKCDLQLIARAVALGQLQWFVGTAWEDCVWCDWELGMHDDNVVSFPRNKDHATARAIGNTRAITIASSLSHHAFALWHRMDEHDRLAITSSRRSVVVSGRGKRIKLRAVAADTSARFPVQSFVLRVIAVEVYFKELFECPLPNVRGITLGLLVSAWEVLYSLGAALIEQMPSVSTIRNVRDLWQFAPRIPRTKLCALLVDAIGIDLTIARAIIDFLTFTESQSDELWARPLVQLDDATVTPVLTCLIQPNPLRMVEKWMKFGGLDLQSRGESLEEHARERLADALRESRLLKNAGVCPYRYRFKGLADDPGDIDLLIWFGDTVLIGEAKCNLFPARASEFHNYFVTLERAAHQVRRKASAFGSQADRFWRGVAKRSAPKTTNVVPFILTNLCVGVGLKFADVPVTDILILERFLGDGFLERFVTFDPKRMGYTGGQKLELYKTQAEAEQVVAQYLVDPPQLQHFRDAVKPVTNIIPGVDGEDKPWLLIDYDVDIEGERLEKFRPPSTLESPQREIPAA